jgi:hypothetical protein
MSESLRLAIPTTVGISGFVILTKVGSPVRHPDESRDLPFVIPTKVGISQSTMNNFAPLGAHERCASAWSATW